MKLCLVCSNKPNRSSYKYCSNKCQREYQYREYIKNWKLDLKNGTVTKNISRHIKRYLLEVYGEKCIICGWNQKNSVTKKGSFGSRSHKWKRE